MNCIKYKGKEYKSGDTIIFKIDEVIVRGKLYIKPKESYDSANWINAYVCHNNKNLVMNTLGHLQLTLETKIHLMVVMLKSYVQILMLTIKKILKLVKN